jgi:type I restriction enzyme S subunit
MTEASGNGACAELPEGWEWKTLGELCHPPQYGYTTKAAGEGELKLLRTTDISKGPISWDTVPYCSTPPEDPEKYRLQTGDLLIARSGSVGLNTLIGDPPDSVFASYMIRFRPRDSALGPYLRAFMRSPLYWGEVNRRAVGTGMNNINAKKLAGIPVPCPPAGARNGLVAMIDHTLGGVTLGEERLAEAREQLRAYRLACVEAALDVSDGVEPTTEMLGDVAEIQSGIAKGRPREAATTELPYIRTANVQAGFLDLREMKSLSVTSAQRERHRLQVGDVLVLEGGDADKVGRGWLWEGQIDECLHQNHVFAVRPDQARLLPRYLAHFINGPAARRYFLSVAKQTTNLASINKTNLRGLPVPVPDVIHQQEVVARLDGLAAAIAALTHEVTEGQLAADRMRRAVLTRALTGRLLSSETSGAAVIATPASA